MRLGLGPMVLAWLSCVSVAVASRSCSESSLVALVLLTAREEATPLVQGRGRGEEARWGFEFRN